MNIGKYHHPVMKFALNTLHIVVVCLLVNVMCFLIMIRLWGHGQDISPEDVSALEIGMDANDCALALTVHPDIMGRPGQVRRVSLAKSGIGNFFVVQSSIDLDFDENDRLLRVIVERSYGLDEWPIDVTQSTE